MVDTQDQSAAIEVSLTSREEKAKQIAQYTLWEVSSELEDPIFKRMRFDIPNTVTSLDGKVVDVLLDPGLDLSEAQKQEVINAFESKYGNGSSIEKSVHLSFSEGNQISMSIPAELADGVLVEASPTDTVDATECNDDLVAQVQAAQRGRTIQYQPTKLEKPASANTPKAPHVISSGASVIVGGIEADIGDNRAVTSMVDPSQVSKAIRDLCAQLAGNIATTSIDIGRSNGGLRTEVPTVSVGEEGTDGTFDLDGLLAEAVAAVDKK